MGEIDTKHIESVQVALTLFGEKCDQKKLRSGSSSSSSSSFDQETDIEGLQKDLANYKVQTEAKDAAYLQLLHKLDHYHETTQELSDQLKNSEVQRDKYFEECQEARARVNELEAKLKEMTDQSQEVIKIKEQLTHVLSELKAVQDEVLSMETELVAAREEKLKAMIQAESVELSANIEKEKAEKLLKSVNDLNRAISFSRHTSFDEELENQLISKSVFIDSLQMELNQANELLTSSDKAVSDIINDIHKLKEDLKEKEKQNSDKAAYISELEGEMKQLKEELKHETCLNRNVETLTDELEILKNGLEEVRERENEAQIEIALLKAELHRVRAKIAASEASEARAGKLQPILTDELITESDNKKSETDYKITISVEEYESLIKKAEKTNQSPRKDLELEILKKELESATAKVAEFRTRAEQAGSRAEAAEKAKISLEEQLRKWREQKKRRKAALAALREESLSREYSSSSYDIDTKPRRSHQPLYEVLNMKF
ncbi:protein WEAK CHLOROPLAST MOVEMENT UNDER BLUE LIGHT-like 1 [Mercurialis annua]|uniref:protein WEAK CHLOROPLAST MOVEMENT UNDER BLUE LIGHT-like 1 n=1 Tax=Mercurialis annua TaxID=3986 RepID=UPI00215FF48C|nr:protein WEAK CHLOROPLAST MOVEMENT UNDER BLUE LIGHT-like 1 [Mercurialis annua]